MKHLVASIFAVLTVAAAILPNAAQEVVRHRLDPETSLLMPEIGAVATLEEGADAVAFGRMLPTEVRPEANRGVDVKQGDEILMMNGERVRSIADLRALYDGLEKGDEVKLALKRGEERFLVSFEKGDGELAGGMHGGARVVVAGGDGEEVELAHEARALLGERDGAVAVVARLPEGRLEEGDVVEKVNGEAVATLAEYRDAYGALEIGDALKLTVRRGGETFDVDVEKAERPGGMMMIRGDGR